MLAACCCADDDGEPVPGSAGAEHAAAASFAAILRDVPDDVCRCPLRSGWAGCRDGAPCMTAVPETRDSPRCVGPLPSAPLPLRCNASARGFGRPCGAVEDAAAEGFDDTSMAPSLRCGVGHLVSAKPGARSGSPDKGRAPLLWPSMASPPLLPDALPRLAGAVSANNRRTEAAAMALFGDADGAWCGAGWSTRDTGGRRHWPSWRCLLLLRAPAATLTVEEDEGSTDEEGGGWCRAGRVDLTW